MNVRMPRIRIEELSPVETLSEDQMALIHGAGRKKKWEFSGQAMEVLEVRQVLSALTVAPASSEQPAIPQELMPAVMNALQQIRSQAGNISSGPGLIAFSSDDARQLFLKTLDNTLGGQLQGQTSAALQAAGISVVSRASLTEIDQFLTAGTAAAQDLIVLRFQSTSSGTLLLTAQQSQQISAAGKTLAAGTTGSVSGTLEVSGDLVFGLDRSGRAFVREGSQLSAAVKASGGFTTSAGSGSQVALSLQGLGHLNHSTSFAIDDGDANSGENLYLDVDAVFTGFSSNSVFAGDLNFAGVNASFTVPGLSAPISVPAELKLDPSGTQAELTIDDAAVEEAVLDAAARAVVQATGKLAERTRQLTDKISDIPVIGEQIEAELTRRLDSLLDIDLPEQGVEDYLADRGFEIDSTIGFSDLIEGNLTDLFVITWHRQEMGSLITQTATGSFGKTDGSGIGFALGGTLTVQPQYAITVTFGVDVTGGLFILEGSEVEVSITADGSLRGKAAIPNLVNVQVNASAPAGQHVIHATLSAGVTDGDARSGERLYAADLLQSSFATVVDARVQLDARFAVDSPVQQLPAVIRGALNGLLPDSITWTAGVSYDAITKTLDYHISNNSLTDIVTAFQEADGVEDALKNYMLDRIAENNPLPASTQDFLGTKIPLLDQNVMDLLDIPKAAQYVLAPRAFRSRPAGIDRDESLSFQLDLFRTENGIPVNIRRLLSGETFDIVSLDIQQSFVKDLAKITVLPETVVASYFGIVNATVEVNLNPGFFLEVDMLTGVDSLGYYIEGAKHDAISKDMKPNLKLGGRIEAQIIAEADLLFLLDFARVTGTVGLRGFGDMTLVSPHPQTQKVRFSDINPDTIAVGLGVDLTLQVHGELGLVDNDAWDADVFLYGDSPDDRRLIELYRSNKVTLGDIQDQLAEYRQRLESQGKQRILAAAAVIPDPHLLAAAIMIIYSDSGMGEVVRKLVVDYRMRVDQAAKALFRMREEAVRIADRLRTATVRINTNTIGGVSSSREAVDTLARQRSSGADKVGDAFRRIGEIASHLWNHCGDNLSEFAKAIQALGADTEELVREVWVKCRDHLKGDLAKFAAALNAVNAVNAGIDRIATEVWKQTAGNAAERALQLVTALRAAAKSFPEITAQLWSRLSGTYTEKMRVLVGTLISARAGVSDFAESVWSKTEGKLQDRVRLLGESLVAMKATPAQIAEQLWHRCGRDLQTLAEAMNGAKVKIGDIAAELWKKVSEQRVNDAQKLVNYAKALDAARATTGEIARQLWEKSSEDLYRFTKALASVVTDPGELAGEVWNYAANTPASSRLRNTFLAIAGSSGANLGNSRALKAIIAADKLRDHQLDIARFLLNDLKVDEYTTVILMMGHRFNPLQTFAGIAYRLGADKGYAAGIRALQSAGKLGKDINSTVKFLLNQAQIGLEHTARTLSQLRFSRLDIFFSVAGSAGVGQGVTNGIRALTRSDLLDSHQLKIGRFLIHEAKQGLETTARTMVAYGYNRLQTFAGIAYSSGAGLGYAEGIRAISRAGELTDSWNAKAAFLLNEAQIGLSRTGDSLRQLGADATSAFWAVVNGARKSHADAIRSLVGGGLLGNSYSAISRFLFARLSLSSARSALNDLF